MTQSLSSLDPLLVTIVVATLAIGLPIFVVLSIRFLWDRNLNLGRSKELQKAHLAVAPHRQLEHQMNLSFPAVQPGTEEPRDLAYLQQLAAKPAAANPSVATPRAAAATPAKHQPATHLPAVQQPVTPPPAPQQVSVPPPLPQEPSAETPRRARCQLTRVNPLCQPYSSNSDG